MRVTLDTSLWHQVPALSLAVAAGITQVAPDRFVTLLATPPQDPTTPGAQIQLQIQVTAHHPKLFWGYIQMEQSQMGAKLVDHKLKGLAELRVATLIGCPF